MPDWGWCLKPRVFKCPGLGEQEIVFRLVGCMGSRLFTAWQRIDTSDNENTWKS
ncbi:hypothetical protein OJ996_20555 [Luteolibacter sp. GHJ8]|uniref:Uncharacterized protein n=1 Tax=Luteolibacter rhizosphaerae TaxID=2989719 RepID=A0ABT3G910_9BACT|nr:hypothetical protein [Luteolibacter rhizosphaerae]MCW1915991.1 hypothetical protein [Luteolibacter rhizosphaerae]